MEISDSVKCHFFCKAKTNQLYFEASLARNKPIEASQRQKISSMDRCTQKFPLGPSLVRLP